MRQLPGVCRTSWAVCKQRGCAPELARRCRAVSWAVLLVNLHGPRVRVVTSLHMCAAVLLFHCAPPGCESSYLHMLTRRLQQPLQEEGLAGRALDQHERQQPEHRRPVHNAAAVWSRHARAAASAPLRACSCLQPLLQLHHRASPAAALTHRPLRISAAGVKGPNVAGVLSLPKMRSKGTCDSSSRDRTAAGTAAGTEHQQGAGTHAGDMHAAAACKRQSKAIHQRACTASHKQSSARSGHHLAQCWRERRERDGQDDERRGAEAACRDLREQRVAVPLAGECGKEAKHCSRRVQGQRAGSRRE